MRKRSPLGCSVMALAPFAFAAVAALGMPPEVSVADDGSGARGGGFFMLFDLIVRQGLLQNYGPVGAAAILLASGVGLATLTWAILAPAFEKENMAMAEDPNDPAGIVAMINARIDRDEDAARRQPAGGFGRRQSPPPLPPKTFDPMQILHRFDAGTFHQGGFDWYFAHAGDERQFPQVRSELANRGLGELADLFDRALALFEADAAYGQSDYLQKMRQLDEQAREHGPALRRHLADWRSANGLGEFND